MDAHHSPELLIPTLLTIPELARDVMRLVVFEDTRIRSGSYQKVAHWEYTAKSLNVNALYSSSGANLAFSCLRTRANESNEKGKGVEKPLKKFYIPENTRTGSINASQLGGEANKGGISPMSISSRQASRECLYLYSTKYYFP